MKITIDIPTTHAYYTPVARFAAMLEALAPSCGVEGMGQAMRLAHPDWFVYTGGNHVSLHRRNAGERLLLVTF